MSVWLEVIEGIRGKGEQKKEKKSRIRMYKIMQNNNNMYSPLNTYEFLCHIPGAAQGVGASETERRVLNKVSETKRMF